MHKLQIQNKASHAEILIYGPIGDSGWDPGVSAKEFRDQLSVIPEDREIHLRINSPGGSVFDGVAMHEALKDRRDKITAYVDGQASSIASFVMLAAGKRVIAENAWVMIHEPTLYTGGDAEDFERYGKLLEGIGTQLAEAYSATTGKSVSEMRAAMKAETWMRGKDAVEFGLVHEMSPALEVAAISNLETFRNVPEELKKKQTGETRNTMAENKAAGDTPANPSADIAALTKSIAALQNNFERERNSRILGNLKAVCDRNPTLVYDQWKDRVIQDETLIDTLAALPGASTDPAIPPLPATAATPTVTGGSKPLIEIYKAMKAGPDREKFRADNWSVLDTPKARQDLLVARGHLDPRNANTIAAALTPDVVGDRVITVAFNKLSAFRLMMTAFTTDAMAPRSTVQVPFASAGPTVLENPASFESGDVTLDGKSIAVNHLSSAFHTTSDQIQKGILVGNFVDIATFKLLDALSDKVTALMVVGTFAAAAYVAGAGSTMTVAKLSALYALAKNFPRKLLLLDAGHTAYLIAASRDNFRFNEQGAYQFDAIAEHNRWTGATANTCGFLMSDAAIGLVSGLPKKESSVQALFATSTAQLPVGITVEVNSWANSAGRAAWSSLDVVFGAGAIDTSVGQRIVTA